MITWNPDPQNYQLLAAKSERTISTPVGKKDGKIIFAHVIFECEINKAVVSSLGDYLMYLEEILDKRT